MKKNFIIAIILLSSLYCNAVTLPFNAPAPPSWTKVAECTAENGVNVRKFPSTTAPRMVYNENMIEDYETPVIYLAYWGSTTGGTIHPVTFQGIAPVVSEQPGWIQLLNEGPKRKSNAWVSSKYCKVSEITPITPDTNLRSLDFMLLPTPSGVEGTYGILMCTDDLNAEVIFYVGRLVDGRIVCPYVYCCGYYDNTQCADENAPCSLVKDDIEYGYRLTFNRQGATGIETEYGVSFYPDINKLPAEIISFIVKEAKPVDGATPAIVYGYNGGYCLLCD